MEYTLTEIETRVLGSLVEKAVTTPEYYPLTLSALINACNQKSNRDPVVGYDGRSVGTALETLKDKGLVRIMMGGDSRVPKYRQYFAEAYAVSPAEEAILCELMLRGPQTPGELRGRLERFDQHKDIAEVEQLLDALAARPRPLIVKLPRQAGRKESRYFQLLAGAPSAEYLEGAAPPPEARPSRDRLGQLEEEVRSLREAIDALQQEFAEFRAQFN